MSQTTGARKGKIIKQQAIDKSVKKKPTLTISQVGILHGAPAIAFGGVETGKQ